MTQVTVTITGTEALRRKLRRAMHLEDIAKDDIAKLAEYTRSVAYSLAPKDRGEGAGNITVQVHGLSAEVISPDRHMYVMEFGRTPGARQPSTNVLAGWGSRHGFAQRDLFVLARSIGQRGIRAHRFMKRAAEAAQAKLGATVKDIAIKVERLWV